MSFAAANLVAVSEASAGRRIRSVRMGAPGSPANIARPFDVPVLGEIAYSVSGAVIQPAYHLLKLVLHCVIRGSELSSSQRS